MYPYVGITFVFGCVIAYKLLRRLYAWNDAGIKRRDAHRKGVELERAIRDARQRAAMRTPPPPPEPSFPTWPANPITGTAGEWDHIPRIAFDLDTQKEFGGSRYHTHYVSPDKANDLWDDWGFDMAPGVYITDKRTGPELIGESERTRWFIPHDQLIKWPCSVCGNELESGARFCGQCGTPVRTELQI